MVHRLALFLGAIGAAGVLALAMNLGGLFSAAPLAAQQSAAPDATRTVVDKVYVAPTPAPRVVNRPPRTSAARAHRGHDGGEGGD